MTGPTLPADDPPSPCTQVCELDAETGWCLGCGRDIDEIAAWGSATPQRRREILAQLPARLERLRHHGA